MSWFSRASVVLGVRSLAVVQVASLAAGGLVIALDARAESQQRARERAVEHALTRYGDAVRPIITEVWGAVRPVDEVLRVLDAPRPADLYAVADALRHTPAAARLEASRAALRRLAVPRQLRGDHGSLLVLVNAMREDLKSMTPARKAGVDAHIERLYGPGPDGLRGSYEALPGVVDAIFQRVGGQRPAAPRPGPSREMWIVQADRACAQAGLQQSSALHDPRGAEEARRALARSAAINSRLAAALRRITIPRDDRATVTRTVISRLTLVDRHSSAARQLAQSRDPATMLSAYARLDATRAAMRTVSRGLTDYGATLCGSYFSTGPQSPRTADTPTTTA